MVSGWKCHLTLIPSDSMIVDKNSILFLPSVKYLDVTLDNALTMQRHVSDVCRSCFLALRQISSISSFLSVKSTATLVHATVTSRLDYCHSTLSGISSDPLAHLQRVQKSAARLALKSTSVTTSLLSSNNSSGFPFLSRFSIKLLSLPFITLTTPSYPTSLIYSQLASSHTLCAQPLRNS